MVVPFTKSIYIRLANSIICGKYSIISPPIGEQRFHLFSLIAQNMGEKSYYFPLVTNRLPISTYLDIEIRNMENKTKFHPNPKLKLVACDIHNLQSPLDVLLTGKKAENKN